MTRLSLVDQAFFMLETEQRPMSIGALVVLARPPGFRGRFADSLLETMLRCPVGPPFSYRIKPGAVKGLVALEEDEQIDPAAQVRRHRLRAGSDLQGLFKRVCAIHATRLPRDAPLFELHVFEGLPDRRLALYFKTHHGLIDGIAFIRAFKSMVTTSPDEHKPRAIWEGLRHVPDTAETRASTGAGGFVQFAVGAQRTAGDLMRLLWQQQLRKAGLGRGLVTPFVSTPGVLAAEPSPHRVLAHCVLSLPKVRSIAARGGAKVNDVLLTVLDMAMHRYLAERGSSPRRPLVADMPVALNDRGGAGNRITILQVPMGRPEATPAQRLGEVVRETTQVKEQVRTLSGSALTVYSIAGHALASAIESLGLRELPMLANAVISNPAGLEHRAYFNGAEVELALPVSVVAHHQVLNITVTTYVDGLHVTFIALEEAIPDLERLADYTVTALAALDADLPTHDRAGPKARQRQRASRSHGAGTPASQRSMPHRAPRSMDA